VMQQTIEDGGRVSQLHAEDWDPLHMIALTAYANISISGVLDGAALGTGLEPAGDFT
jgi:hypothetical protein